MADSVILGYRSSAKYSRRLIQWKSSAILLAAKNQEEPLLFFSHLLKPKRDWRPLKA